MAKLNDFSFKRIPGFQQINEFKDTIRDLWNNSKYQAQTGAAVPAYSANPGETYFRINSTSVAMYVCYSANSWVLLSSV